MEFSLQGVVQKVLEGSPIAILLLFIAFLIRQNVYLQKQNATKDQQILTMVKEGHDALAAQTSAIQSIRELLAELRGEFLSHRRDDA